MTVHDRHHRRQRPVRHGGADRPRRAHHHDAVRRSVGPVRRRRRCAARAWRSWRGTASGTGILPSELNFRANIYGFKVLGVERILSASAVGSLKEEYKPLDILVPGSVLRPHEGPHQHLLRPRPRRARRASRIRSAPTWRRSRADAAEAVGATVHRGGTYVNMEGPQFSTLAESKLYRSWGMDVIGMTNLQEAKLAREAEICYATLALVTDYDCWHPDHDSVTVDLIIANLMQNARDGAEDDRRGGGAARRRRAPARARTRWRPPSSRGRSTCPSRRSRSSRRSSGSIM